MSLFVPVALWFGSTALVAQQSDPKPPDQLTVDVDVRQTSEPVSKYEFGMFIEHIGPIIYRSLWSEMLDDRKFYFPISSKDPASAPRAQGSSSRNAQLRKWRPVGPDEAVVMSRDGAFVGDQSPRIQLDSSTPYGIRQSGLALIKGKKYTGRIYLRGTPGSNVKVSLVWGPGAD
ncbi:MAG: alpha-N-arabinofuranosidase, partial [Bryobacteraceae bacterium]